MVDFVCRLFKLGKGVLSFIDCSGKSDNRVVNSLLNFRVRKQRIGFGNQFASLLRQISNLADHSFQVVFVVCNDVVKAAEYFIELSTCFGYGINCSNNVALHIRRYLHHAGSHIALQDFARFNQFCSLRSLGLL